MTTTTTPERETAILETIARRVERSGATPDAHRKARKAALHALMRGASGHRALAAAQDALTPPGVEIHPTPSAAKFAREAKADPTRWNIRPVGRGFAHELRFIGEPEVSSDD